MKYPPLTKKGAKLLEAFDEAAQNHGWQRDQGTGHAVVRAEEQHRKAKARLAAYLRKLERAPEVS